jgi:hypothetical protein
VGPARLERATPYSGVARGRRPLAAVCVTPSETPRWRVARYCGSLTGTGAVVLVPGPLLPIPSAA